MIIGREINLSGPSVESYSKQLIYYLHMYLEMIDFDMNVHSISPREKEKSKIILRWLFYPNKKEIIKDYVSIQNEVQNETIYLVKNYTRCIMQLLGKIAECVVIDRCIRDINCNIICMNIAMFKENIFYRYPDINYEEYIPFSPSFKQVFYEDEDGFVTGYPVPDYNPLHTTKDIAWCKKENIMSQLKAQIHELEYLENAKLQIKTSLDYRNLNLEPYRITPIIYFDLMNDCDKLMKEKSKYKLYSIFSARSINQDMENEIEMYFKILSAYVTNMNDSIEINDLSVQNNQELAMLFRTPIQQLVRYRPNDISGIIEMVKKYRIPIVVEG